ncbi:MAG: biotin--[Bacteroides sp.]|nr:biotin--[acetyl-CoA-carboxylase] ligase [Bacteroides sp.]
MNPNPDLFPYPLVALQETESTNLYLTRLCRDLQDSVLPFTTVSAEFQTAGKGQRGNSWEAESGKNLLFSVVCYPTMLHARRQFILSQIVSLAIKEELECRVDEVSIKWPNDIYWRDKKICGILIENELCGTQIGRSICGIGLNVNQEVFRSNAPNPVSLKQITGREHNRHELLLAIVQRIATAFRQLAGETGEHYVDGLSVRYARSLFRRRGYHPYRDAGGVFQARLLRVEADGRLVLEDESGRERTYLFKEVQYIV